MMNFELAIMVVLLTCATACQAPEQESSSNGSVPVNKIDTISGLMVDENFELVRGQCTACHSAKLITQNSASREGWEQMIRWMQKDQGLWDLGESEPLILDYLSKHYGLKQKGRRAPLTDIEWYLLPDKP
jgi:CxxC motif-containing protein (DUF1111 family)